ncbi:hypothetical protein BJ138DRAFT_1164737 [Hygrophoropsis aurantiaca]|uniref:Uncharacterized protein n=1 Tax=Hygrophoropsis aurantiaca TaxID=72124 RepID=A0ACB7ZWE7_9AGAM|nr:hypothetical protein BJ138DRAFT_1164737 [Hygrophoropsis aurantiaca]
MHWQRYVDRYDGRKPPRPPITRSLYIIDPHPPDYSPNHRTSSSFCLIIKCACIRVVNMSLFYAYFVDKNHQPAVCVFKTREAADEWWRMISTRCRDSLRIKRNGPQNFEHDSAGMDTILRLSDEAGLPTEIALEHLPVTGLTDHVSGGSFIIRSKANPLECWYCPPAKSGFIDSGTLVYASTTNHTRFRVTRVPEPSSNSTPSDIDADAGEAKPVCILIGQDKITIALAPPESANLFVTTQQTPAGDPNSQLTVIKGGILQMNFNDFKKIIMTGPEIALPCHCNGGSKAGCTCGSGSIVKNLFTVVDHGKEWELSNW